MAPFVVELTPGEVRYVDVVDEVAVDDADCLFGVIVVGVAVGAGVDAAVVLFRDPATNRLKNRKHSRCKVSHRSSVN